MAPVPQAAVRMDGKRVVVTGATSGLGAVLAESLARAGAALVLVGRDPTRTESFAQRLASSGASVRSHVTDLADRAQARSLASKLREENPRLDVLINNAGALVYTFSTTPSGDERTFGLNVLAPFVLMEGLLPCLTASGAGRVVNVASAAHRMGTLNFGDLDRRQKYSGWAAYSQSKLALLMITYEAARRHFDRPVTFNACHPGFVRSHFGVEGAAGMQGAFLGAGKRIAAISPERGARTPLYLATSPEVAHTSGEYFAKSRPHPSSAASHDREAAKRLWEICERRSGLLEPAMTVG